MDFAQPHGVEADASPERLAEVQQSMAMAGLSIACVTSCAHFHDLDATTRDENLRKARRTVDIAADWGCRHVRVLGDRVPEDGTKAQVLDQVTGCLRELADYAAPREITVSLEMHASFADPDYSVPVAERVDRRNFGLIFNSQFRGGGERNPAWGVQAGEAIRGMYDRFRPYLTSIHTHEMEPPDLLPHYRELFTLLKEDGWDGWVSQEAAYRGPDPEKVLALYTALFHALAG